MIRTALRCGAEIIGESFKTGGDVDAYELDIKEWAKGLIWLTIAGAP